MPIKYVPFIPEPVEGQAVLGNFNRILRYKGADDVSMTLQRGMPLYEMEKQETVGENADGNMVIRGECVSACAYLKEQGIQVDLVYIDPPFASGADYAKKVYIRRNPKVAEAIAQAEQELDVDELKVFEEKMYGDIWDKEKYPIDETTPCIKDIFLSDITAYDVQAAAGFVYGLPEMPVQNVRINNCEIYMDEQADVAYPAMMDQLEPMAQKGFYMRNAVNVELNHVKLYGVKGKLWDRTETVQ